MRAFTGFPDEQKCELYKLDGRFFQAKTERKIAGRPTLGGGEVCRRDAGATAVAAPEIDLEPGKQRS